MIKISQEAMKRWGQIEDNIKTLLLSNVYCSKCSDTVKIVKFTPEIMDNDLVLKGKCSVCDNNVARLIDSSDDDLEEYPDELSIEDVDKMIDNQIKKNNILLNKFENYLYSQNLAPKTIKKHLANVDFYINTFLIHYEIEKPEDNLNSIDMYFDHFMPNKTTFGSVSDTKSSIGSLKKFYHFMLKINKISEDEYSKLLQLIKNNKQNWFDVYSEDYENDDDW